MKKPNFLLSLAAGAGLTFVMLGCSVDGVNDTLEEGSDPKPARMSANFDLSLGDIPVPNDLLFAGTKDLTLNFPGTDTTNAVLFPDPTNPAIYADPTLALASQDGWSAVAPFAFNFSSRDANLALDGSSVVSGSTVRIFKVNVLREDINAGLVDDAGDPLPDAGIILPTGPVLSVDRELSAAEFIATQASATSIAVLPTVAFEQQASYMVIVTDGLRDSDGLAVLNSSQFGIVKSPVPISTADPAPGQLDVRGLIPVQGLVNAMINAASASDSSISYTNTILAFQFTVQSIGKVMTTAKTVYIDGAIAAGAVPNMTFTDLEADTTTITGLGAADLYKGSISLNYLLGLPSEGNPTAPLNTHWKTAEFVPDGLGGFFANPDPLGNLTYANPLPQVNGIETAPILVAMPKSALGCAKPEGGYPVTIFLHGIRQNRTNMLGVADGLAGPGSCRAVVAIDQPLHGLAEDQGYGLVATDTLGLYEGVVAGGLRERTLGLDYVDNATGLPGADMIPDASGTHYINLTYLLVARDNAKQAIFDLLYLEQAIAYMDIDGDAAPDFDSSNVAFVGHSLGGINGTGLLAYSGTNQFIAAAFNTPVVPVIKSAALVNAGGGSIGQLIGSETFGPAILAGLSVAFGADVGTDEFNATLASYTFAAQTVVDSSDPVNLAALAVNNGVPTLLLQNEGDIVVPNAVATAPLSGTEALSRALGLTVTATEEAGFVVGSRLFTKLNVGVHASLLIPDEATVEMQTQIGTFIGSGGAGVTVTDPTILAQ